MQTPDHPPTEAPPARKRPSPDSALGEHLVEPVQCGSRRVTLRRPRWSSVFLDLAVEASDVGNASFAWTVCGMRREQVQALRDALDAVLSGADRPQPAHGWTREAAHDRENRPMRQLRERHVEDLEATRREPGVPQGRTAP